MIPQHCLLSVFNGLVWWAQAKARQILYSHANSNLILAEKQLALYKLKLDPAPFQKSFLSQGWVDDIQSFLNASLPAPWPMQYEAYQIDSEFDNKKERHCKK